MDGKKQDKHYFPGDEVPDPPPVCEGPNKSDPATSPSDEDDDGTEEYEAHVPWWIVLPFIPWLGPLGTAPEFLPALAW